MNLKQIYR